MTRTVFPMWRERWWISAVLLAVSGTAWSDPPPNWDQVLRSFDTVDHPCSYLRTESESGATTVESFSAASGEDGWSLQSIDGRTPSGDELKRYAAESSARAKRANPFLFNPAEFVDEASVRLISSDAPWRFFFQVRETADLPHRLSEHLEGELEWSPDSRAVFRVLNTAPLRYNAAIRLTDYERVVEFRKVPGTNGLVRVLEVTKAQGKALGIRSVELDSETRYSEHSCSPSAALAGPQLNSRQLRE